MTGGRETKHGCESIRQIMTTSMLFYVAKQHDIEKKTFLYGASFFQFSLFYCTVWVSTMKGIICAWNRFPITDDERRIVVL